MIDKLQQICKDVYRELGLRHSETDGECAKASYALFNRLTELGIKSTLYVVNDQHCFVTTMVDNSEYVLDLTYSQFDTYTKNPLVESMMLYRERRSMNDVWRTHGADKIFSTTSKEQFLSFLVDWPVDQQPIDSTISK